ncbi:hypothetical protein Ocin01_17083 [Orchesella cincta]|uniref:Uncharacterized protein n=1 Tax=Orchesella cincta TaxID=48709 RepID=A0A1D2M9E4_ORCCI|nr:hypothetical protein Ocin01_17083 [Orchesella cincta]
MEQIKGDSRFGIDGICDIMVRFGGISWRTIFQASIHWRYLHYFEITQQEVDEPMSQEPVGKPNVDATPNESTSRGVPTNTLPEASACCVPKTGRKVVKAKGAKAVAGKRKSQRLASANRRRSKSKAQVDGKQWRLSKFFSEAGNPPQSLLLVKKRTRSKSLSTSANKRMKPSESQKRRKKPSGERRRKKKPSGERRRRKPVASEKRRKKSSGEREAKKKPSRTTSSQASRFRKREKKSSGELTSEKRTTKKSSVNRRRKPSVSQKRSKKKVSGQQRRTKPGVQPSAVRRSSRLAGRGIGRPRTKPKMTKREERAFHKANLQKNALEFAKKRRENAKQKKQDLK